MPQIYTSGDRERYWGAHCTQPLETVDFTPGVRLAVHRAARQAFTILGQIMQRHTYTVRRGDTGSYNCRKIAGSNSWSAHAFGLAVDVNWNTNPLGDRLVTDMPPAMIDEIQALRTRSGERVFRWGGDWDDNDATPHSKYDAMHFEIIACPEALQSGIPTDPTEETEENVLKRGDQGDAVAFFQTCLNKGRNAGLTVDGIFGAATETAVKNYQKAADPLEATGRIDGVTAALLARFNVPGVQGPKGDPGPPGPAGKAGKRGLPGPSPTGVTFHEQGVVFLYGGDTSQ